MCRLKRFDSCGSLTQLQQGAYYLRFDVTQLAVVLPLSRRQLVEAGDEAHHVPVGERHASLAAREHVADVAQLEHTGKQEMKRKYTQTSI